MDNCCSDERTQSAYRYQFKKITIRWKWGKVACHLKYTKYSSARWCHPFLRGCEPGLVRNRPLNGCWAGSFFFTSLSFSSLCSRGATLLPSCSDLSITFQSWNQPFLLADPQNGALQLQVIPDSMSSKRLSCILLHILWKGFPAEPFMHWWAGQEQGWKSKMDAETHQGEPKVEFDNSQRMAMVSSIEYPYGLVLSLLVLVIM